MSPANRIVLSAHKAMRGELPVERRKGGWCLQTTRLVLEHALGWADGELYRRFPDQVEGATPAPRNYWARDIQRSLRAAGWGVPLAEAAPGDLLAYWKAAQNEYGDYVGHIAILLEHGWVFENINPVYRAGSGAFSNAALSLTPLAVWVAAKDVEAFRVPEEIL